MISKPEAQIIACQYVTKLAQESGESLTLINAETMERSFGWVFFYNSKDYLETGDSDSMLLGNAPFIVDRINGEVHVTGSAEPVEDYIEEYEKHWRKI